MLNKIKHYLLVILIFVLLLITGCANKEYKEFTEDFNKTYLEIAQSVELSNTLETLKNLQSDKNKNKIDELRVLLENIQNKVPENKVEEYKRYGNSYKGLILLRESYSKWDKLSFDQKRKIWNEIHLIVIDRDH